MTARGSSGGAFFKGPASSTGEDVAELHLHEPYLGRMVMEWLELQPHVVWQTGVSLAAALFNGKINLDQAEGIADLIDADTTAQHQQAIRQLDGVCRIRPKLAQAINCLSGELKL